MIWCHNTFGHEDIPNWVAGLLHAQNIFDGGDHGSYEDTFYRYLNVGMKVPFSTGTDWFIYDFSRVYVPLAGELTTKRWLAELAAGRSYITNGPLLELTADGQQDRRYASPRTPATKSAFRAGRSAATTFGSVGADPQRRGRPFAPRPSATAGTLRPASTSSSASPGPAGSPCAFPTTPARTSSASRCLPTPARSTSRSAAAGCSGPRWPAAC